MLLRKGSRGSSVKTLQQQLSFLGFDVGEIDGIFGAQTEDAVEQFQQKNKTYPDGIVGPITRRLIAEEAGEEAPDVPVENDPFEPGEKLTWVKCPVDKLDDIPGYGVLTLRSDTASAFKKFYAELKKMGGVVTSSGGRRRLTQKSSASRSKKSMHYTGRAFDLALYSGMQNPEKDPFIITRDDKNPRKWKVWCRTANPFVAQVHLNGVYVKRSKTKSGKTRTELHTKSVVCRAIDFTGLAEKHGFKRISARRSFMSGGKYAGAEWWHFQWEDGLVQGKTSFGEDLLKIYAKEEAQKFQYWDEVKNIKFGEGWA